MSDTDPIYELRMKLNGAVRLLRDAEDIARFAHRPDHPCADRIRSIYEQITEDVLNGRTSRPPLMQRYNAVLGELQAVLAAPASPDNPETGDTTDPTASA